MDAEVLERRFLPANSCCTAVFEHAFDIITIADAQGRFEYVNPAACRTFGYTQQEFLSLRAADLLAPPEHPRLPQEVLPLAVNETMVGEWISRRKDGRYFPAEVTVTRIDGGRILAIGRDITERKEHQSTLQASNERLAVALESASIGEWEMDPDTLQVTTSKIHDAILGYEDGVPAWSYQLALQHVVEEDRAVFEDAYRSALQLGEGHSEFRIRRPSGEIRWVEIHGRVLRDPSGKVIRLIGSVLDTTHRKSFEREQKYTTRVRQFGNNSGNHGGAPPSHSADSLYEKCWTYARDGMIVAEVDTGRLVGMNPQAEELLGYGEDELIGKPVSLLHPAFEHEHVREAFLSATAARVSSPERAFHIKRKDGALVPVEIASSGLWNLGGHPVVLGIFRDLSDLEARDERLSKASFALRAYADAALALMHAETPSGLMQQVCDAITKDSPFHAAWVGAAKQDAEQSIEVLAVSGVAEEYLRGIRLSWSEKKTVGRGPAGIALRSGKTVNIGDCRTDPRFRPWRDRAEAVNVSSAASVPFRMQDRAAVLCVYSPSPHAFGPVVADAFHHLAREIGIGVTTLIERERLATERQKTEAAQLDLAKALNGVIGAISTAMETRDPYTAGHQRRVAEISTAIATELNWPKDRVEALRLAALVHDIGKIAIPAEILTRPTGLRPAEWLLMKEHPETGYEILKDIPFHWPIAETVRQHQERLDGSGYPRGLQGEQIIMSARILAVADVLEATASQRPYRAALGLEKALLEIQTQAPGKLDPEVVQTCVRLFREKGFTCQDLRCQPEEAVLVSRTHLDPRCDTE